MTDQQIIDFILAYIDDSKAVRDNIENWLTEFKELTGI